MKLNLQTLLIGGGAVALGVWVYKRFVTGTNLIFVPLGISTGGPGLNVQIGIQNPTNGALTLNSLAGNVMVNGTSIANVSNFAGVVIPGNAQTAITVGVAPNWLGLGITATSIIQNGFKGVKLVGTANVNGYALPIDITF